MSDDLDLGEAADFILGERPEMSEETVWAVLNELRDPPAKGQEKIALQRKIQAAVLSGTGWEGVPPEMRRQADEASERARRARAAAKPPAAPVETPPPAPGYR